jgi:tRNA(fMet)-specific endonuclease VapC
MRTGNNTYLLDTNIVIDLLRGKAEIAKGIESANEVFLPIFALGELYFGAQNSQRPLEQKALINQFLKFVTVLNTGQQTAVLYGQIKSQLKKDGKPIPENDIWIAALAKEYGIILVTRDTHFGAVTGLEKINW